MSYGIIGCHRSSGKHRESTTTDRCTHIVSRAPPPAGDDLGRYILQYIASVALHWLQYITVRYIALHCMTLQCRIVQHSTAQYSTVQYSTVQYMYLRDRVELLGHFITVHYSTLRYIIVHDMTLRGSILQYITLPARPSRADRKRDV